MISKSDLLGAASLVIAATVIGLFNEAAAYWFLGAVVLAGIAVNYGKVKQKLGL